jgi:hypothetical protein
LTIFGFSCTTKSNGLVFCNLANIFFPVAPPCCSFFFFAGSLELLLLLLLLDAELGFFGTVCAFMKAIAIGVKGVGLFSFVPVGAAIGFGIDFTDDDDDDWAVDAGNVDLTGADGFLDADCFETRDDNDVGRDNDSEDVVGTRIFGPVAGVTYDLNVVIGIFGGAGASTLACFVF